MYQTPGNPYGNTYGAPQRAATKKEFLAFPENQKMKKEINTAAILCYICAGITFLISVILSGMCDDRNAARGVDQRDRLTDSQLLPFHISGLSGRKIALKRLSDVPDDAVLDQHPRKMRAADRFLRHLGHPVQINRNPQIIELGHHLTHALTALHAHSLKHPHQLIGLTDRIPEDMYLGIASCADLNARNHPDAQTLSGNLMSGELALALHFQRGHHLPAFPALRRICSPA